MIDSMMIGSTPTEELVEQLGKNYRQERAHFECRVFKEQLLRMFGPPPGGAKVVIKSNPHDFGSYLTVDCKYDMDQREEVDYAILMENHIPVYWDEMACQMLGLEYTEERRQYHEEWVKPELKEVCDEWD